MIRLDTAQKEKVRTLYVHLPFCRRKWGYCHFYSEPGSPSKMTELAGAYFACLRRELDDYREVAGPFNTLYFGGGTPSLVPAVEYEKFIKHLSDDYGFVGHESGGPEISCEVNPEAVTLAPANFRLRPYETPFESKVVPAVFLEDWLRKPTQVVSESFSSMNFLLKVASASMRGAVSSLFTAGVAGVVS